MTNTFSCKIQYLDDSNPFVTNIFPEPTKPPVFSFLTNVPLNSQLATIHSTLKAPLKVRICFDYMICLCDHSSFLF
jgi:hypothetical protein